MLLARARDRRATRDARAAGPRVATVASGAYGTVSAAIEETAYDVMLDGSFVVIREAGIEEVDIRFVTTVSKS